LINVLLCTVFEISNYFRFRPFYEVNNEFLDKPGMGRLLSITRKLGVKQVLKPVHQKSNVFGCETNPELRGEMTATNAASAVL
jgi:hypothetical protein